MHSVGLLRLPSELCLLAHAELCLLLLHLVGLEGAQERLHLPLLLILDGLGLLLEQVKSLPVFA